MKNLLPIENPRPVDEISTATHSAMARSVDFSAELGFEPEGFDAFGDVSARLEQEEKDFNQGPRQDHVSYPDKAPVTVVLAPQDQDSDATFTADSIRYLEGEIRQALANQVVASRVPASDLIAWAEMTDRLMDTELLLAIHTATISADYPMAAPDLPETDHIPGSEVEAPSMSAMLNGEEPDLFRRLPEDDEGFVVEDSGYFSDE